MLFWLGPVMRTGKEYQPQSPGEIAKLGIAERVRRTGSAFDLISKVLNDVSSIGGPIEVHPKWNLLQRMTVHREERLRSIMMRNTAVVKIIREASS
jgi:hypothetical protein